jgi:hypothetical protein
MPRAATPTRALAALLAAAPLGPALLAPGCAAQAPARSTVIQAGDLIDTTNTMAQALAGSPWLAGRTADTQPAIVLRPQELTNLSDTRLSPAEQWVAVSRVVMSPAMLALFRERNVIVQMPPRPANPSDTREVADPAATTPEPPATITPTHTLRPTLRSLTRASSLAPGSQDAGRKDLYLFEYTITDLSTRTIVWTGSTELARLATGSLVD